MTSSATESDENGSAGWMKTPNAAGALKLGSVIVSGTVFVAVSITDTLLEPWFAT